MLKSNQTQNISRAVMHIPEYNGININLKEFIQNVIKRQGKRNVERKHLRDFSSSEEPSQRLLCFLKIVWSLLSPVLLQVGKGNFHLRSSNQVFLEDVRMDFWRSTALFGR
ncbi:hypothetical protein TSAR_009377 [Trichomalopsis sarcophagae]|uniref:Uncharacterized protein n=1 Tax=Trichomalopsis sarcophagae TaxID=543379 RepID=A0A232EEB9_9HYME|nr:hypothetical protein TSAR_009377 [Trichomalopsis sarcophagae]